MIEAELRAEIDSITGEADPDRARVRQVVGRLLDLLESGDVRAASPEEGGRWRVHTWIKQGLLLAFRFGENVAVAVPPVFRFADRDLLMPQAARPASEGVRIVPGGTVVRRGAYLAPGVVVMPPAYVNVGAWIGPGTMVDSHVLVGSCAQIGGGVHLSAASQIGGVLEPVGARPVIVEEEAFVGGGCGIYEGTRVGRGAVLAAGVILTRSTPLYDVVHAAVRKAGTGGNLEVPPGAVVVPGARAVAGDFARRHGLHLQTPIIVKYRDARTDASAALEEALR